MRWSRCLAVACSIAAVAGCSLAIEPTSIEDSPNAADCAVDDDCLAVGTTCCECPTFAVSRFESRYGACRGVECEPAECTDSVVARCIRADEEGPGKCELRCAPLACPSGCDDGFLIEANGCLTCACAGGQTSSDGCFLDDDCVQTRADCCGCARGGADTAVLATGRERFEQDRDSKCPSTTSCPEVNVCNSEQEPLCIQGKCLLLEEELPPGACGRSDLPCPPGLVCTVNFSDQLTLRGLGICLPS